MCRADAAQEHSAGLGIRKGPFLDGSSRIWCRRQASACRTHRLESFPVEVIPGCLMPAPSIEKPCKSWRALLGPGFAALVVASVAAIAAAGARAESGYELWLRYTPLQAEERARTVDEFNYVGYAGNGTSLEVAAAELSRGLGRLYDRAVDVAPPAMTARINVAGTPVFLGTPAELDRIGVDVSIDSDSGDAYVVRRVAYRLGDATVVAGNSDVAVQIGRAHV